MTGAVGGLYDTRKRKKVKVESLAAVVRLHFRQHIIDGVGGSPKAVMSRGMILFLREWSAMDMGGINIGEH